MIIVGHSAGALVAASATLQSAKSVVGAVFVSPPFFFKKPAPVTKPWSKLKSRYIMAKSMTDRGESLKKVHLSTNVERILTDSFVEKFAAPTRFPRFADACVEGMMVKEAPYEDLLDELLSIPSNDEGRSPVPLLFVYGREDNIKPLPEEKQKELLQLKIDAIDKTTRDQQQVLETIIVEKSHHYVQHEQPEELAKEIVTFVQKNILL